MGRGIVDYFNQIIYHKKKMLLPIILVSIIIGIFIGIFFKSFKINIGMQLIGIIVLNFILIVYNLINEDIEKYDRNREFKSYYWTINIFCYAIVLFINFNKLKEMFKEVKIDYIPNDLYMITICTGAYVFLLWLIYILVFSNLKRTKLSTNGLELEIDDTVLSSKQNILLNNIQQCIENTRIINFEMDKYVAKYITEDLIDENNTIKSTYTYKDLFVRLREVSNKLISSSESSILVDFKSINELEEIKEEYNIPNNLYNKIFSHINNLSGNESSIFIERNLVFVNYKISSIAHDALINNRIIGIIEFKDIKEGYVGYGSLLLVSLKMFDYITTLSIIPIYEGGLENE